MSQLVRLEGKNTTQNAHCALEQKGYNGYTYIALRASEELVLDGWMGLDHSHPLDCYNY